MDQNNNQTNNQTNMNELPTFNADYQNQIQQQSVQQPVQSVVEQSVPTVQQEQQTTKIEVPENIIPKKENENDENSASGKLIPVALLSTVVILGLLYLTVNKFEMAFFAIPAYLVLCSIIFAIVDKKKSDFPQSALIGGMIGAVLAFLMSMKNTDEVNLYTYYTIYSAGFGIIGLIIGGMLTKLIADKKNVAALQTLMTIIITIAIFAGPFYLYKNKPDIAYRYMFYRIDEIKATSEDEFVIKQLQNRYNETFTCSNVKYGLDEKKIKVTTRTCKDKNGKEISVKSITYNEAELQFIVEDNYMDVLLLDDFKDALGKSVAAVTNGTTTISLYHNENCNLVGDCIDCKEYLENYEKLTNNDNKYSGSKELKLEKYKSMKPIEFVNEYGFKIRIEVAGRYSDMADSTYETMVDNILSTLNKSGVKNTNGYEIIIYQYDSASQIKYQLYKVEGTSSNDKSFKNPQVLKV